jgi:hypothetical protein
VFGVTEPPVTTTDYGWPGPWPQRIATLCLTATQHPVDPTPSRLGKALAAQACARPRSGKAAEPIPTERPPDARPSTSTQSTTSASTATSHRRREDLQTTVFAAEPHTDDLERLAYAVDLGTVRHLSGSSLP